MLNIVADNFKNAINDYIYLLEKKYPQKAILKLIGDKYLLSSVERTILFRGITTKNKIISRSTKLASENELFNQTIHVDCYNTLITIGSYLNGSTVFIGNDNFLRDASEIHGKIFRTELYEKSLSLIFYYLKTKNVSNILFYLDKPVSYSGKLCSDINDLLNKEKINGKAQTCESPDFILKNIDFGFCSTSDSIIIDNSNVKIFDLSRKTIEFHYKPKFLDLTKME
ncbi:MAG: DUF434 domain-containing protein [Bacteroidales bacterium]|nr:DUF434 domain-containing protein [Bacteroidales bacterium]